MTGRDAALLLSLLVGQHAGVAGLRAGRRERQHGRDRKGLIRFRAGRGELPRVASGRGSHGDGLRRVDDRAAADRQNEIQSLASAERYALADEGNLGVGGYAAELDKGQASVKQAALHAVEQTGGTGARAAEMNENAVRTVFLDALADAVLDVPSKDDFGRRFNSKIQHIALPALRVKNHTSIIVVLLKKVKRLDKI